MKKNLDNNQIDLIPILKIILINKSKLFIIIAISLAISIGLFINQPTKFRSSVEIHPVSVFDIQKYKSYNNLINHTKFFKIDQNFLTNLFIAKINERKIFEEAIIKFELLESENKALKKIKNYKESKKFKDLVSNKSLLINLIPPIK